MKILKLSLFLILILLISCNKISEEFMYLEIKSPTNCIHRVYAKENGDIRIEVAIDLSISDTIYKNEKIEVIETTKFKLDNISKETINNIIKKINDSDLIKNNYASDAFRYKLKVKGSLKRDVFKTDSSIYKIIQIIEKNSKRELDLYCYRY